MREKTEFIAELIPLVKEEASNIRIHATNYEKSLLNRDTFYAHDVHSCIYGQMTGTCDSIRAAELIELCCQRIYVEDKESGYIETLNGHPSEVGLKNVSSRHTKFLSPIENMIFDEAGGRRAGIQIMDYIQGISEELIFD